MLSAHVKDFGWWIESTDEETYGPVTKATLERFLSEGIISPNTTIRHCLKFHSAPIADQDLLRKDAAPPKLRTGDRLSELWPKKRKAAASLAESEIECARHQRPAVLTCIRCLAPFCTKCMMKRRRQICHMCKKCQGSLYNRRSAAYLLDLGVLQIVPTVAIGVPLAMALGPGAGEASINLISLASTGAFFFRDPVMKGASPGKRLLGLKVVQQKDGVSQLTYGQGFVRNLSLMIPFFNLVDLSIPYRSPTQRRYGDRWAGTQVIDTPEKIEKTRAKIRSRLENKGIQLIIDQQANLQDFARIV